MVALPLQLLGPPELYRPRDSDSDDPPTAGEHPFTDLLVTKFNKTRIQAPSRPPELGKTENQSATYLSSGVPSLDFFYHVVPTQKPNSLSLSQRLLTSWGSDPETTLKLACNLRGVRGSGKSDKEGFFAVALRLHVSHPKTLACNVPFWAEFGCYKDLPELLYRLLEGEDVRERRRREWQEKKRRAGTHDPGKKKLPPFHPEKNTKRRRKGRMTSGGSNIVREMKMANALKRSKLDKEAARVVRKEKRVAMAKKGLERYRHDPDYRYLFDRISDFFAAKLRSDVGLLASGNRRSISLAAKWCPSLDSAYDRATLLCESVAKKLFPREEYKEYEGVEEAHYVYRVRDRLRKEVLVPLRKALELPEVYIGKGRWDLVRYNRVASVAMRFYKEKFLRHDGERFVKYLKDVKDGKARIAAGALLPHEIIAGLNDREADGGLVSELQWKRMVDDLLVNRKMLSNCLVMCAVSGSLEGTPVEASLALGMLVSELSEDSWKGKLITFSESPRLEVIKGESLLDKIQFVRRLDCGRNVDFQKVFDMILKVAVDGKLKKEDMVKRVFVFSDMEFDKASSSPWETDYLVIRRKFKEEGYKVPEVVFWNLRNSKATPVPAGQKGVALVSGYSRNLLKFFLEGDRVVTDPIDFMEAAISGEDEYSKLIVLD